MFLKWVCKIEKKSYYAKIKRKFLSHTSLCNALAGAIFGIYYSILSKSISLGLK